MSKDVDNPKWNYYKWPDDHLKSGMRGIAFDNDTVYGFVNTFLEALANIGKGYYTYILNNQKIYDKTKAIPQTERVFAYELYHQWSCRLCPQKEWILNAELRKHIEWFYGDENTELSSESHNILNNEKENSNSRDFPDMVLHKGQGKDEQMIVCEIKRKDRLGSDIKDDIDRLCLFTKIKDPKSHDEYYRSYKCGIFLCFNVDFDSIADEVEKQFFEKKYENLNNILCVSACYKKEENDYVQTICYQSLGNIIEQVRIKRLLKEEIKTRELPKGFPRKRIGIKKKY